MFLENLLNGLTSSNVHYVRARFINILTISIYMLSEFFEESVLIDNLKKIFHTYFNIVNSIDLQNEHGKENADDEESLVDKSELKIMRMNLAKAENIAQKNIYPQKMSFTKGNSEIRINSKFSNVKF